MGVRLVLTQKFNRHHGRVGHVFQGRYKAILVQKESYLLELARYIVLNPVRAQMVRSAKDWPWSSYRATAGIKQANNGLKVDWILSSFSSRKSIAVKRYREFVSEGKNQPKPWEQLRNQIYLGSDQFVDEMQCKITADTDLSEIPSSQKRQIAKPIKYYAENYSDRDAAIINSYASGGYSMKEIGDYFKLHYSRVTIPSLNKLHAWLDASLEQVPPTTAVGKALHYLHNEWDKLIRYRDNGRLEIDNNAAENTIRPFVIGRKNWLFSASVKDVKASANLYSLIETVKANGLEPYAYLRYLFTELPKATTVEDVEALLPGTINPDQIKIH